MELTKVFLDCTMLGSVLPVAHQSPSGFGDPSVMPKGCLLGRSVSIFVPSLVKLLLRPREMARDENDHALIYLRSSIFCLQAEGSRGQSETSSKRK